MSRPIIKAKRALRGVKRRAEPYDTDSTKRQAVEAFTPKQYLYKMLANMPHKARAIDKIIHNETVLDGVIEYLQHDEPTGKIPFEYVLQNRLLRLFGNKQTVGVFLV